MKEILHGEIQSLEIMIKEELEDIDLEDDLEILQEAFEKIEKLRADYRAKTITLSKIDNDYKIEETEKNKDDMAKVLKSIRTKKKDSQRLKKQNEATAAEDLRKAKETEEKKVKAEVKVKKAREVTNAAASAKSDEENDKVTKQKAREVTDAAASAQNDEENEKIAEHKAREVTDAAASAKNDEENDKIVKQKAREVTDAEASAKKDNEKIDMIVKQEAREVKNAAASAKRDENGKAAERSGKIKIEKKVRANDEATGAQKKIEEKIDMSEKARAVELAATSDEKNVIEEGVEKKSEDEGQNDENELIESNDGEFETDITKDEFARKSHKEHLANENPVVKFEIVKDVLEHDDKLLPNYAQRNNKVTIEVAAAFPLSQAHGGESVASSLNRTHSPTGVVGNKVGAAWKEEVGEESAILDDKRDLNRNGKNSDEDDQKFGANKDEEDDDDWAPEDISEEAVKARVEALSVGLGGLVIDIDMEKAENKRINIFHKYVKNEVHSGLYELLFDEKITKKDFELMMQKALPQKVASKMDDHVFRVYEMDNSEKIDFVEFIVVYQIIAEVSPEEVLKQILCVFDANADGPINPKEMQRLVRKMMLLIKDVDNSEQFQQAHPTEYRQISTSDKECGEFVTDSGLVVPIVSVKPREGIGVEQGEEVLETFKGGWISSGLYFNLAAGQRTASAQLGQTFKAKVSDTCQHERCCPQPDDLRLHDI